MEILNFAKGNEAEIALLAFIVSIMNTLGGVWLFFRYDRKLKNLQINQYEKENEKEKKAEIKANSYRGKNGFVHVKFVNSGQSDALNVRVEFVTPLIELDSIEIEKDHWGPYELINPQGSREERLRVRYSHHPDAIYVKVIWDDAYEKNRERELSIPIY